jgi:hypothetical protein
MHKQEEAEKTVQESRQSFFKNYIMKKSIFLLLVVVFAVASAFTKSLPSGDQYVHLSNGTFMLKSQAITQELGECVQTGDFCSYIQVSPLVNPNDLNDPDNYVQDPASISERWVDTP